MEAAVYILCILTTLACGALLLRNYRRTRVRLLVWCAIFFFTLAVENLILFIDLILIPSIDLSLVRNSVALAGISLMLYGLVWETR